MTKKRVDKSQPHTISNLVIIIIIIDIKLIKIHNNNQNNMQISILIMLIACMLLQLTKPSDAYICDKNEPTNYNPVIGIVSQELYAAGNKLTNYSYIASS